MTRTELEKYLGKNVKITLFDGDVVIGQLHKTGEDIFKNNLNLYLPQNRYFCVFDTGGISCVISCVFRVSHIKSLEQIEDEIMTPQEAIELFQTIVIQVPKDKSNKYYKAIMIAKKALEKQIPKKTLPTSGDIFEFGNCPNCGAEFNSELIAEYEIQCCPYCGQALDWG